MQIQASNETPYRIPEDPGFSRRFDGLRVACTTGASGVACGQLLALHGDVDRFVESLKRGLYQAPLVWNADQKAASRWISLQHHRLARNARRVADALAKDPGADPEQMRQAAALGMHHLGEAMKSEMADAAREPRHYVALHAFLRPAMDGGWENHEIALQIQTHEVSCNVQSLYFRALLLARSGGVLTLQQIEILDAWLLMWMPSMRGVVEAPLGPSLRADLESNHGLRTRPAELAARGLYLPLAPLERCFSSLVRKFQNGEIVPADGHASRFRLEEHMVVLDLVRRALRGVRREPASRAHREAWSAAAELHVGIAEITARAFTATQANGARIYDVMRRKVRVVDVSASGLGLEGDLAGCGEIVVGDVVALRLTPDGPVELGKVARRARADDGGRVHIGVPGATGSPEAGILVGVRQLSKAVRRLSVTYSAGTASARSEQMLFVAGEDASGRNDAFLVAESAIADRRPFVAEVDGQSFTMGLNRVRDRGRGWALAGFEIFAMAKTPILAAA
jgi:hypothetical protein